MATGVVSQVFAGGTVHCFRVDVTTIPQVCRGRPKWLEECRMFVPTCRAGAEDQANRPLRVLLYEIIEVRLTCVDAL